MRRTALLGATIAAATGLGMGLVPLAGDAATAETPAPASPAVVFSPVNLRASYTRFLAKEKAEPRGIAYARGGHGTPVTVPAPAACSEPNCPMTYHGGDVQHSPKVYLLLWGPKWSTTTGVATYLNDFLSGLGVEPDDSWSTTTEQYGDATGHPTFSGSVFKGVFHDTTAPPTGATQDQLAAEADAFYSDQSLTGGVDTQIVVATQTGTCPAGFYGQSGSVCNNPSGAYCAWHSTSSVNSVPYTNLPYLLDSGNPGCGEDAVSKADDGFSIVEGHEYAETVTDPDPDSGWIDLNDASGGEVGDKCAWTGLADVTFSTGSFAMQPLWSNSANKCVQSTVKPLAITTTSLRTGAVGAPYSATLTATGGFAPYKWSRISGSKPPGTSFSTGGVWSGTPTAAGTYGFSVQVTDHFGTTATKALSITITTVSITTTSLPSGTVGTAYNASVTAAGGTAPYTWSRISGSKPPGTSFSTAGDWSGTPTATGTYDFSVQATDHNGVTATKALSITITALTIMTTSLPSGTVGTAYSASVTAAGGTTPYTWSRISGSKPPGTSFSSAGVWSGTPTTAGTYSFSIQVTDRSGATATKAFQIVIAS